MFHFLSASTASFGGFSPLANLLIIFFGALALVAGPKRLTAGSRLLMRQVRAFILLPALAVGYFVGRRRAKSSPVNLSAVDQPRQQPAVRSQLQMPPTVELSVVIPFYNPGESLRPTVERTLSVLEVSKISFEIIAVSDGSTDSSELTLAGLGPNVRVEVNPVNRGKGAALRTGMMQARGAYIGFVDCDGDIDPAHLLAYLATAQSGNHDVVYANKQLNGAVSGASAKRKIMSATFSSAMALLFSMNVNDTQTGCKLFRREVLANVIPKTTEERFAFDLEFFVAATDSGYRDMVGAPVEIREREAGSTVSAKTAVATLFDALVIYSRRQLTAGYSDPVQGRSASYTWRDTFIDNCDSVVSRVSQLPEPRGGWDALLDARSPRLAA